jgi:PAS domain-containing protein
MPRVRRAGFVRAHRLVSCPGRLGLGDSSLPRKNVGRFYLLVLQYCVCAVFYYLGELLTMAGWDSIDGWLLYGVHDFHRLLFLVPIIYAGYVFGTKAVIIITIIVINTLLPRALFISPFPDPLLRMLLFIIVAVAIGYLTARVHRATYRCSLLQNKLWGGQDQFDRVLDAMPSGVLIIGPDQLVRFANKVARQRFGEEVGCSYDEYLKEADIVRQLADLPVSPENIVQPEGRQGDVPVIPFTDCDGAVCRLIIIDVSR